MQNVPYYPINIVSGDDFSLTFSWNLKDCTDGTTTGVDISGASVEALLLDSANQELLEFTAVIVSASDGKITISLTDVQTATLNGTTTKPVETIGRYFVRLTLAGGRKITILRGKVSITNVEGL